MSKTKVLYALLFMLITNTLIAQDTVRLHKYYALLQIAKDDTSRVNALRSLGTCYADSNPDSAIIFTSKALGLAEKINWTKGIAACSLNMGYYFDGKSNYDSALFFSGKALKASVIVGDKNRIAQAYINRGSFYMHLLRYTDAMNDFKKAMQLSEATNNQGKIARCNMSFGSIYIAQSNFGAALPYYQKALTVFTALKDTEQIANAGGTVGSIYLHLKNYVEAEPLLKSAITMEVKIKDYFRLTDNYYDLGTLYIQQKHFDQGISMMQLAVKNAKLYGDPKMIALADSYLGDAFYKNKQYKAAIDAYSMGLQSSVGANSIEADQSNYLGLANTLHETDDDKNAFLNLKKAYELNDTISSRNQQKELLQLQTQFETEKKEKENLLLKADNKTSHARLVAAFVSLFLMVVLSVAIYSNRQTKIKNIHTLKLLNTQLAQQKEEISSINTILALRALRSQMNPHFIFNSMSAIQECILSGKIDDADNYLSKLSRLMRLVLANAEQETISLDKEIEMLELYIQLEAVRLEDSFHYEINLDENIFPDEINVPALLLQPFAENAIWHGLLPKENNRELKIKITASTNYLQYCIEDNGIGRERSAELNRFKKKHQSKGIQIASERLVIIKTRFDKPETGFTIIDLFNDQQIPCGTMVLIKLPLNL